MSKPPKLRMLRPRIQELKQLPAPTLPAVPRIRGRAAQELRRRTWLRNPLCAECGQPTIPPAFEVDHRQSLQAGGTNDDSNLAVVHIDCHKAKTAREAASAPRTG
jgi:5-methylcytosine-specific restriction endonuclease McrA